MRILHFQKKTTHSLLLEKKNEIKHKEMYFCGRGTEMTTTRNANCKLYITCSLNGSGPTN